MVVRPTPEQRAEMAAYIDAKEPGLLDDLGISRRSGRDARCDQHGWPDPRWHADNCTCG